MNRGSRVLAGVDFSKAAREAFDYALALSSRYGAELVAVHAVPPDRPFSWRARGRTEFTRVMLHAERIVLPRADTGTDLDVAALAPEMALRREGATGSAGPGS